MMSGSAIARHQPRSRRVWSAALIVATSLLGACTKSIDAVTETRAGSATAGTLYSIETAGGYPNLVLRALIAWQGIADRLSTQFGVSLYRVRYWTPGIDGKLVVASGLIAFPRVEHLRGVVSFQHGTATQRASAPSTPDPSNGVLAAAAFAGRGYLLVAADYIGLGASMSSHPYLHAATEASSAIDLLRAARGVVAAAGMQWPDELLLTGFSQGGHATLAMQRALESTPEEGLSVRASAPIAGPFDLAAISLPFALEGRSQASSLYLAYMVNSYANVYGEALDTALQEPYASLVPTLFDGAHDGDSIMAALPRNPRQMFRDDFLRAYEDGESNWLRERLISNSLYDWSPHAPIRLYFGSLDVDVSPREAEFEAARLKERGADVTTVDVGPFDHEGSVLQSALMLLVWFDELGRSPRS
jgi:hypothetical protein